MEETENENIAEAEAEEFPEEIFDDPEEEVKEAEAPKQEAEQNTVCKSFIGL